MGDRRLYHFHRCNHSFWLVEKQVLTFQAITPQKLAMSIAWWACNVEQKLIDFDLTLWAILVEKELRLLTNFLKTCIFSFSTKINKFQSGIFNFSWNCSMLIYYTTQAVRGPITKIDQSKCSIAGPIFSKYRTGHCPEWSCTCVFAFFSRVINLLLTKLARDRTGRISALGLFCTLRSVRTVKTSGRYSLSTALAFG